MKAKHIVIMIVAAMVGGGITNWLLQEQRAYAATDSIVECIRAKEFRPVDSKGKTKAYLATADDVPGLVFLDSKGEKIRVMLSTNLTTSDSGLRFFDDKSKEVLYLGTTGTGNTSFIILDADGKKRVMLGMVTIKGEKNSMLMLSKADNNTLYYVKDDGVRLDMTVDGEATLRMGAIDKGSLIDVGTGDTKKYMFWTKP